MNTETQKRKAARKKKLTKSVALRRAETLLEVSARCAAANDLVSVLRTLVDITARALDCDRGTLFLNDSETGELYSRVAQGDLVREIRILNTSGFAGHVFQTGEPVITHDPYSIKISEAIKIQIDLGAESTIAAQRDQEKIAVEIKSFIADSDISEFHGALGQYLNYLQALELKDPARILYLAVPIDTYSEFFKIPFIQMSLKRYAVNLIVYNPIKEEIEQWIKFNNTEN